MADLELIQGILASAETKILLLVLDGVGGLPVEPGGPTELEAAKTPNLDRLAAEGVTGLHQPVAPGITPGSGPGHIGLFGYDPIRYQIGRGVLEALGVGFELEPEDLAARGNFCTVDAAGVITDRRAGRISTEKAAELCAELRGIDLPGVEVFVEPVREHRFLLVLRGPELVEGVADTDPGREGVPPLDVVAEGAEARDTAGRVETWVNEARKRLKDHEPANMVLLRGLARRPDWPLFPAVFGLRAVAVAQYPMYRGVARLVGMDSVEVGPGRDELLSALENVWDDHDFVFVHVKDTDKAGEDGDFDRKVKVIEEIDGHLPRIMALDPDVVLVTGDHSTPAALRSHSWHPVPVLLWSKTARRDGVERFGESHCLRGGLGICRSDDLMPLALAHAGRLTKYGA
ncbi:MAG: 2,3-bisphosphoglycerate-independent phosphoglycerate mutase [Gemmatimonadetes bacterium]|uniref:2,3-bisphosphoglycerate-independent phosphoglycerate mutase n=1 Tax=Candidatus Kutchimonas denitrificans TaxID=3056748 RepID=A0AAE4ZBC0_9BACT|nr:2,3-bisphosphoglycerate-independent phosphoglycerate mutase [Gemmatimonadota bacterium]NIR74335.1 2,3-bisphosphoglycerate-independent phosphoglycerate mutase [Candidatus Kutchimonas denitrificans]NIS02586.1 2,3-bisphosphoglycerate-independent phosphoglycerate mutase [Gemmatimonadota bacterium]NIT68461.1 2,3-bisphosphoglycerate-independent phosphoglycerate mutase [Gemmatimonadota bacterium]NIU51938.1 2,3-bisphosphoglycerate-independent phosphoglycerate mutase [Gemmatimonadota bacterium]